MLLLILLLFIIFSLVINILFFLVSEKSFSNILDQFKDDKRSSMNAIKIKQYIHEKINNFSQLIQNKKKGWE